MKIIVTGKNGQLGYDLYKLLKDREEVLPVGRDDFDITDFDKTYKFIKGHKPDLVIHCAAYTKVDDCENNIDLAYQVNTIGAGNIAIVCSDIGAQMVYISTDYVFDGTKNTPYTEFDVPKPLNAYGKSKLAGENIIKEVLNKHYIIRTSWLYGLNGNNFVKAVLKKAYDNDVIKVVNDQYGSPTYTRDLAEAIYFLIKTGAYGTYHITNSGVTTWYHFAKKIFEIRGIYAKIESISTEEYNALASRPGYSALDNLVLRSRFGYKLRNWEEAINEYLKEMRD